MFDLTRMIANNVTCFCESVHVSRSQVWKTRATETLPEHLVNITRRCSWTILNGNMFKPFLSHRTNPKSNVNCCPYWVGITFHAVVPGSQSFTLPALQLDPDLPPGYSKNKRGKSPSVASGWSSRGPRIYPAAWEEKQKQSKQSSKQLDGEDLEKNKEGTQSLTATALTGNVELFTIFHFALGKRGVCYLIRRKLLK